MRIVTVRPPWAQLIIFEGKDVENRVRNIAGTYRGPVAIHVGLNYDEDAHIWVEPGPTPIALDEDGRYLRPRGVIIGVVDLEAAHVTCPPAYDVDAGLCSPWALRDHWHLKLANPRALTEPIPYKGALGLRTLDDDTTARILAQIGETR